ncbi:E3 ubiquitin protein ligase UPL1-like protein [Tanacetum coccineum]
MAVIASPGFTKVKDAHLFEDYFESTHDSLDLRHITPRLKFTQKNMKRCWVKLKLSDLYLLMDMEKMAKKYMTKSEEKHVSKADMGRTYLKQSKVLIGFVWSVVVFATSVYAARPKAGLRLLLCIESIIRSLGQSYTKVYFINKMNKDEKPTKLQISDEPLCVNEKLESDREIKNKKLEAHADEQEDEDENKNKGIESKDTYRNNLNKHHLSSLLASTDADVFKACLQTLSAFLRKSIGKHIIRDASLSSKLFAFTQGWGGKDEGLGLVACATENVSDPVALELGSTLHFKFYAGNESLKENSDELATQGLQIIHLLEINTYEKTNLKLLRNEAGMTETTDQKFKKPPSSFQAQASSYNLVDEDDDEVEEPMVWKLHVEKLSDCVVPSRDDGDIVEVNYKDMECLEPGSMLVSRYNELLYTKYKGDSFLKFGKWWKRVNLFEKAYVFILIHQSLAIICIPNKEDEMGPVILHLGSLGLHNSSSIFDNIRRILDIITQSNDYHPQLADYGVIFFEQKVSCIPIRLSEIEFRLITFNPELQIFHTFSDDDVPYPQVDCVGEMNFVATR